MEHEGAVTWSLETGKKASWQHSYKNLEEERKDPQALVAIPEVKESVNICKFKLRNLEKL